MSLGYPMGKVRCGTRSVLSIGNCEVDWRAHGMFLDLSYVSHPGDT